MATNGNGRNGGQPVVTMTVRPATAADHADAARQYSQLAAAHAGEAAKRAKAEARKR